MSSHLLTRPLLAFIRSSVVIMAVETEGKTDAQVEEEMVGLANDTPYGLSASVFSKDYSKALRVASGIEAGAVHINSIVSSTTTMGRINSVVYLLLTPLPPSPYLSL